MPQNLLLNFVTRCLKNISFQNWRFGEEIVDFRLTFVLCLQTRQNYERVTHAFGKLTKINQKSEPSRYLTPSI